MHKDSDNRVAEAFLNGLEIFMYQVGCTPITHESGKILYLCQKCKNTKFVCSETVWKHLVNSFYITILYLASTWRGLW